MKKLIFVVVLCLTAQGALFSCDNEKPPLAVQALLVAQISEQQVIKRDSEEEATQVVWENSDTYCVATGALCCFGAIGALVAPVYSAGSVMAVVGSSGGYVASLKVLQARDNEFLAKTKLSSFQGSKANK